MRATRACGRCRACIAGLEQFCKRGEMLGKRRDGGYAECIVVPAAAAWTWRWNSPACRPLTQ